VTRINADLDPKVLKRMHLLAELREITMVPASLRRSLRTKNPAAVMAAVPKHFTLNKGHVSFFYNKLRFLQNRFDKLVAEMQARGYAPDVSRKTAFDGFDNMWYGNWTSTPADDAIVIERINFRISQKPHLYKD
jgi:deoxyribonuclease (pyrimidine dimer)